MWYVDGFDESEFLVVRIPVTGVEPDEFGKAQGLIEGELYLGGGFPLTDDAKELLTQRSGIRFDPGLEYFAEVLQDFPGEVRFGWFPFAESLLRFCGESVLEVDGSRRIVRKSFTLPGQDTDDDAVLGMLLDHVEYRGRPPIDERVPLHGPFPLPRIVISSFDLVDVEDEVGALLEWGGRSVPDLERVASTMFSLVRRAGSRYRLQVPADADVSTGFHEVVLIDRDANTLELLMANSGGIETDGR